MSPMWLPEGWLFFHVIQSVSPFWRMCDILSTSISEKALWSSDLAPTKLVPLSHLISLMFPQCSINLLSAWMNQRVSMFCTTSKCTVQLERQVNSIPYCFISFLYCSTINGRKMSIPAFVKAGSVLILSAERSATFSSPNLARRYRHLTHLEMKDRTAEFVFTIQYPDDLILYKIYIFFYHDQQTDDTTLQVS